MNEPIGAIYFFKIMINYKVSLIIPVRDEELTLPRLLSSIRSQSRHPDEIIIVDGGSKDGTASFLKSYISLGYPIDLLSVPDAFPGKGRNLGVRSSRYELIAFTDAGIVLHPQWLEKLLIPIEQNPDVDIVFGSYEPVTDSFFKECASLICVGPYSVIEGEKMRPYFIASSLMRKKVWNHIGGQREDLRSAEDLIFIKRAMDSGFTVAYAPNALVYWNIPSNLKILFMRYMVYSTSNIKAGLASEWQYGILRIYIIALCFLLVGIYVNPWGYLLLAALFIIRAGKYVYRNEVQRRWLKIFDMRRLSTVIFIMLTIDIATFIGSIKWVVEKILNRYLRVGL